MPKPIQAPAAEPIDLLENLGDFITLTDQGEEQVRPSSPPELSRSMRRMAELAEDADFERSSANLHSPNGITSFLFESARYYTMFLFLTAAAAGLGISLFLKSWLRDKPQWSRPISYRQRLRDDDE